MGLWDEPQVNVSSITFTVPFPAKPKERPRMGKLGVYNNSEYSAWKHAVRLIAIREATKVGWELSTTSPLRMQLTVRKDSFTVTLTKEDTKRVGRADIDNLLGGVCDALQPARKGGKSIGVGLFSDDRQVHYAAAMFDR